VKEETGRGGRGKDGKICFRGETQKHMGARIWIKKEKQ
jgi:hypothetical protein